MTTNDTTTWRIERLATHLANLLRQAKTLDRGQRRRTQAETAAWSKFEGACSAVHAAGLGNTPNHVQMTVYDAWLVTHDRYGARPDFEPSRNEQQKKWDANMDADLAHRLEEIR